ncbi:MAG: stage V sporulation protein AC [Ruminococcaceae bacterium]|nr:stage V sporulation protein AC [Oscillospiraceae bacterium]
MQMSREEYAKYVVRVSPKSKLVKDIIWAFVVGGLICALGQAFTNVFTNLGLDKTGAGAATSITLIFLSALFTGLGLYDKLAKHAGAGTVVPITGFANSVVSPAIEFKSEGYIMGMCAKMFSIAGPVLVFGISASFVYGLVLLIL